MTKNSALLSICVAAAALLMIALACGSVPVEPAPANVKPVAKSTSTPQEEMTPTASPAVKPDNSGGTVKIESYKLLQDNGSGEAGDEVKSFKPADRVQYFEVQLTEFLKQGSVVKWVFTAVDTSAGKDITITQVETNVAIVANHLIAHLSLDKDFPTGNYKADIFIDGKPLGTIEYTVAE